MEATQTSFSASTLPFYRRLAAMMTFLGLGDRTWWGYEAPNRLVKFHQKLVFIFIQMGLVLEVIYLICNYKTLHPKTVRSMLLILSLDAVSCVCVSSVKLNSFKTIMEVFFKKIHLFNYEGSFARKKAVTADRYIKIAAYFLAIYILSDYILWYSIPIVHFTKHIEEIKNKTVKLQTSLHLWMPFDYEYNIRNWAFTHAMNIYLGFLGCFIFVVYNSLNYTFMFHLIGHVQVLKHRFRTEFSTTLSDSDTSHKLISLIKHHSFVIEIFKYTQRAFGYNVTASYCYNLLCDSLMMYEIMMGDKNDTVKYSILFIVFMEELIKMSLLLEEIRRESDDLADIIYNIPWEDWSISNQKTFMMLLARAQPPLEFISAGGLRAGVRPAISIIKSSFSYYVMLKSAIKAEK